MSLVVEDFASTPIARVVTTWSIGGDPPIPPPVLTIASASDVAGTSTVVVEGASLDQIDRAAWIDQSRRDSASAAVVSSSSERVILQFGDRLLLEAGSNLLLVDHLGRRVAFPVSALNAVEEASSSQHNPVVRFHPNTLDLPGDAQAVPIEAIEAHRPGVLEALSDAGVDSLIRLFPATNSPSGFVFNLLNEPVLAENPGDTYIAILDSTVSPSTAVATLLSHAWVQYADATPNASSLFSADPYWYQQWNLNNVGGAAWVQQVCGYTSVPGMDVGVAGAWPLTQGSPQTRVAVIDNGVLPSHPDLPAHMIVGPHFTPNGEPPSSGHATAVTGILSAVADNNLGLAGIAPGITPVSLKVAVSELAFPDSGSRAIDYCRKQRIPIVNMSWGQESIYPQVRDAVRRASPAGLLPAAATGNENAEVSRYPAAYKRFVTAVTAVLPDGRPWSDFFVTGEPGGEGNSFGSHVDLTAPAGEFVVTTGSAGFTPFYHTLDNCTPGIGSGFGHTSGAAPTVSAVAALLHSYMTVALHHAVTGEDLAKIMELTALDISLFPAASGKDIHTGWGVTRASAALAFVAPPRGVSHGGVGYMGANGALVVSDSATIQSRSFVGVPGLVDGTYSNVTVVHLQGQAILNATFTAPPAFWIRSSGSLGWSDVPLIDRYLDGMDGMLVPGSLTKDVALLRTTLYRIPGFGWFPVEPAKARVAYTAVGDATAPVGVGLDSLGGRLSLELGANPARQRMVFRVTVPCGTDVQLGIYDVAGREVRRLVDGVLTSGRHEVVWDGFRLDGTRSGSSIYFCRLQACGESITRQVIYLTK